MDDRRSPERLGLVAVAVMLGIAVGCGGESDEGDGPRSTPIAGRAGMSSKIGSSGGAVSSSSRFSAGGVVASVAAGGTIGAASGSALGGNGQGGSTGGTVGQSASGASGGVGGRVMAGAGGRGATAGLPGGTNSAGTRAGQAGHAGRGSSLAGAGGRAGAQSLTAGVAGFGNPNGPIGGGGMTAQGGSAGHAGAPASAGAAGACVAKDAVNGTKVVYDSAAAKAATASNLDFFDFPWPELSRSPAELVRFPNPATATGCQANVSDPLLVQLAQAITPDAYRSYVTKLASNFLKDGPNQAQVILRFDGAIDETRLPLPAATLDAAKSPILLVNLASSPKRGRLVPVLSRVLHRSRYLKDNTLSILPHPGFPLEPGTLYAAVVKRDLHAADGSRLGSSKDFELLKQKGLCAPNATYAAAFDLLETQLGIARDDIAMMSVFRSGSPTDTLQARLADVDAIQNPSALANVTVGSATLDASGAFYVVQGNFENLNVQRGTPPYLPLINATLGAVTVTLQPDSTEGSLLTSALPTSAGGSDTSLPRTERLAFKLTVPVGVAEGSISPSGLPVVIYGSGTGGSIDSAIQTGIATRLAESGTAVFSTTPVMHQQRAHSEHIDPSLMSTLKLADTFLGTKYAPSLVGTVESGDLFFNPLDLQAARGNSQQAAVDYAWQARILDGLSLSTNLGGNTVSLSFAAQKIAFVGHSQGAATGPLLATSDRIAAQVLSAPSGHLATNLLGKTLPNDSLSIASMLGYLVCDDPAEPLDVHHPLLNLLLYWFEDTDAANYASNFIAEAPRNPKHVFVLAGTNDHYVAPGSHDAVTTAARLHQVAPALTTSQGQSLLASMLPSAGYGKTYDSLSANFAVRGTLVTGAFRQYHGAQCPDDHFVYTCTDSGFVDWTRFIKTLQDGAPKVP